MPSRQPPPEFTPGPTLGRQLMLARVDKHLFIVDVAKKTNLSRVTVSKIERTGHGDAESIRRIARVLGVDLSAFEHEPAPHDMTPFPPGTPRQAIEDLVASVGATPKELIQGLLADIEKLPSIEMQWAAVETFARTFTRLRLVHGDDRKTD